MFDGKGRVESGASGKGFSHVGGSQSAEGSRRFAES